MELQFSLIFFTSLIFLFLMIVKACRFNSKLPPGPLKLPLIGHLHHLRGLPHHSLTDLAKKHGPIMFLQLGEIPIVIVSSPRLAKAILHTHGLVFADRPSLITSNILSYNGIDIAFSPYGEYWRQLRKICIMELLSAKRVKSFCSLREEEVTNLVQDISSMTGCPVNISKQLFSLTYKITSSAAFGKSCKQEDELLRLIHQIMELNSGLGILDIFPSLTLLLSITGMKRKIEKIHEEFDKILELIINEHKVNRMTNKCSEMEDDVLVDVLLRLQEKNELEIPLQNNSIKAVILDMFTAGTDTSATALEWVFSELMRNPKVMHKAQSEVRQVFDGKERVTENDITELNYLKLVIKETLRLHPPAPLLLPRESRERCEIDGYEIPKRTRVIVNAWAIGRDPDYWSDAEKFKPERFQDLSLDYKGTNFEYIPFGAGRRVCPAILFAVANIEIPLAQLLYHFDWTLPNGVKPQELDMTENFGAAVGRKSNLFLVPHHYEPSLGG